MIDADSFEMIETVTREALERHPVWAHFESPSDRSKILGCGVAPERVDAEIARYEFCGPPPLYPVLQLEPLPPLRHLIHAVEYVSAEGLRFEGYFLAPNAFGLFADEREFCLNQDLGSLSGRVAARFATAVGSTVDALFPLQYRARFVSGDGTRLGGSLERFW
jgi:hypothetical protein